MKGKRKRWFIRLLLAFLILAALWLTRARTFVVLLNSAMEKERLAQGRPVNLDYSLKLFCRRAVISAHVHCIGPGQTCPIHHHPRRWELTQVLRGVARLRTAKGTTKMYVSDYYVAPPGAAHEVCNPGKEPLWCLVVATPPFSENLYLDEEHVDKDKELKIERPRLSGEIDLNSTLGGHITFRARTKGKLPEVGLDSSKQRFLTITAQKKEPIFAFVSQGSQIPKELIERLKQEKESALLLEVNVPTYWQWFVD